MPPSHASAPDPIDLAHLATMTLSDPSLQREVLSLFRKQTEEVMRALAHLSDGAGALAHTLKGSARAIGAFQVADAASDLEQALRERRSAQAALVQLRYAVATAHAAIDEILRTS